jgi:glycerol kinase
MAEMKSGSTAEGPYLLGMDIGTGGVRVGIFDRKGTPVVFEGVEFETHHPRPGRAEQDPETPRILSMMSAGARDENTPWRGWRRKE